MLVAAICACLSMILWSTPVAAQQGNGLGPGARVTVRVTAWNAITLQFETFDALNGTFRVAEDGTLLLPLLGQIFVGEGALSDLSRDLSQQYGRALGLPEPPSVSLEIFEYSPIFVLGDVAQPGRYPFEPGLTALRALALAGGVYRISDPQLGDASSILRLSGTLSELSGQLARERMRAARLRAEIDGAENFEVGALEGSKVTDADDQAALYLQEKNLFESRQEQLERELRSIRETRDLLGTEIMALESKLEGLERQLELVRGATGNLEQLRDRGLARSPALISQQRALIDLEARELDTQTTIYRARQEIEELNRDMTARVDNIQVQTLEDLRATEAEIDRLEIRLSTNRQLLAVAGSAAFVDEEDEFGIVFRVIRGSGAEESRAEVAPATVLRPLDVLEVVRVPITD